MLLWGHDVFVTLSWTFEVVRSVDIAEFNYWFPSPDYYRYVLDRWYCLLTSCYSWFHFCDRRFRYHFFIFYIRLKYVFEVVWGFSDHSYLVSFRRTRKSGSIFDPNNRKSNVTKSNSKRLAKKTNQIYWFSYSLK
jgi:hypothetical protein